MINHARTLLANLAPLPKVTELRSADLKLVDQLEEWIDRDYVPLQGNLAVVKLREALFGPNPSRHSVNYRTRQLLTILHSNRTFERLIVRLGKQITYNDYTSTVFVTPPKDLPSFVELPERLKPVVNQHLVEIFPNRPPFTDLGILWGSSLFTDVIGSAALALIYHTEEERHGEVEGREVLVVARDRLPTGGDGGGRERAATVAGTEG